MNASEKSQNSKPALSVIAIAIVAALSLIYVWSGAGKMMKMQAEAASNAAFAGLKADDQAKLVIEVNQARPGSIRGTLLEKRDETHYERTTKLAKVSWGPETAFVMGKSDDLRTGAVVHVAGKVAADHSVRARQIVILTGYVRVK